jgi:cell pole-organizing protein PopZ
MKRKAKQEFHDEADATGEIPASMRQLARILARFDPLEPREVDTLVAAYSEEDCLERGRSTRSERTFEDAMRWARLVDEHRDDPAVSPKHARWMLDCLASLGRLRLGERSARSPAIDGAITEHATRNDELFEDLLERVRDTIGRNPSWNQALSAALDAPSPFDARVARSKALASLLAQWLDNPSSAPALSVAGIDRDTVRSLETAAAALDTALTHKPAAKPTPFDSPAINIAEGRLFFAMRPIWNDFARARRHARSKLVLPVTPTLLRGLGINTRKKSKRSTES